jgi:hypothetical protein
MNVSDVKKVMKFECLRKNCQVKTIGKKAKPKRKRFFGPEMLFLHLTGTYMGDPAKPAL